MKKEIAVHAFITRKTLLDTWIERNTQENISHFFLHNVTPDVVSQLQNNNNVTIMSVYNTKVTNELKLQLLNKSIERARKEGWKWLISLHDTDTVDVRTSVTIEQLFNSLRPTVSSLYLNVFEAVRTQPMNKNNYNFFSDEEHIFTSAEHFISPRNRYNDGKSDKLGKRLVIIYNVLQHLLIPLCMLLLNHQMIKLNGRIFLMLKIVLGELFHI